MIKKTYGPYTLITVRLDFLCLCYLEKCFYKYIKLSGNACIRLPEFSLEYKRLISN